MARRLRAACACRLKCRERAEARGCHAPRARRERLLGGERVYFDAEIIKRADKLVEQLVEFALTDCSAWAPLILLRLAHVIRVGRRWPGRGTRHG